MTENKNQCPFCKEIFETARKRGCHQRLCKLNPNRDKMLNSLRKNGSNTWKKLNKERVLERKEYKCNCLKCNKEYIVVCTENDYNKGNYKKYCCRSCANSRVISEEQKQKVSEKLSKEKILKRCKCCDSIISNKNKSGYCFKCVRKFRKLNDESIEKLRQGGLHSCKVQSENRRSKNEIAFCELCEKHFNDVKHNEAIFNGWDADIIIEDLKIAILWNGKWHYEKIKNKHSLEQVQSRDKIKIEEIKKCGYIPYIIKDLGKYNLEKVNTEFKNFLDYIKQFED
jgi:hypothetical protein